MTTTEQEAVDTALALIEQEKTEALQLIESAKVIAKKLLETTETSTHIVSIHKQLHEDFVAHVVEDKKNFEAINETLKNVATQTDIKEMMQFMKRVDAGIGIFKFSWNNASKIGGFVLLIVTIGLFIKYGAIGIFMWFFSKK